MIKPLWSEMKKRYEILLAVAGIYGAAAILEHTEPHWYSAPTVVVIGIVGLIFAAKTLVEFLYETFKK